MKTPTIFKHQLFKDSESEETESRGSKHQRLNARNNRLGENLDKPEDKSIGNRYIHFSFNLFP